MRGAPYCTQCWPGGPFVTPPCWRCGERDHYFADGLCDRCHHYAPQRPMSCADCHAWGLLRPHGGCCQGCRGWRVKHPKIAACLLCRRVVSLATNNICRLCHKQGTLLRPVNADRDLTDANTYGQQLFLADLFRQNGTRQDRPARTEPPPQPAPVARHQQLTLLDPPRDLRIGRRLGFPEPPDAEAAAYLIAMADAYAAANNWNRQTLNTVRRGLRILLGIQETPGARIKASQVLELPTINLPAMPILEILTEADLLDDDRTPKIVTYVRQRTADLPEPMQSEIDIWFDVLLNGSRTPPRRKPRNPATIRINLHWALPALRAWAAAGRRSLREISLDDVLSVLPANHDRRNNLVAGLHSIFVVLKARKQVFTDPTRGIPHRRASRVPLPANLTALREALNAPDPTRAAVAALLAFHALMPSQLPTIALTDIRDGRLHLDGRVIPLADPVRQRLTTYLDYRHRRWPRTRNPYLFLNHYNCTRTNPTARTWINKKLGMPAQSIREDRILDEALATGGDTRRLSDLFGLSTTGAQRYTATVDHPSLSETDPATPTRAPGSRTRAHR